MAGSATMRDSIVCKTPFGGGKTVIRSHLQNGRHPPRKNSTVGIACGIHADREEDLQKDGWMTSCRASCGAKESTYVKLTRCHGTERSGDRSWLTKKRLKNQGRMIIIKYTLAAILENSETLRMALNNLHQINILVPLNVR